MEKAKKVTKKMVLEVIEKNLDRFVYEEGAEVTEEDVKAYVENSLAQLDARYEKSKERAAKKRAESDALKDAVYAVLTDDAQSISDILPQVEGAAEDITRAKVVNRLSKLVAEGAAEKDTVRVDGSRLTVYKLAGAPAETVEE